MTPSNRIKLVTNSPMRRVTTRLTVAALSVRPNRIIIAATLFVVFAVITWIRFDPWVPRVLAADDLYNFMLYHGDRFQSPLSASYFAETGQKFRFVFSNAITVESFLLGPRPELYFALNVVIHAISGVMFCFLAAFLSGSRTAAIALACIAITSRFGLYQVVHLTGQVESLSLMFALVSILAVKVSIENDWDERWKWMSLAAAFLALSSHERYVVMLPWLGLFFALHPRAGSLGRRAMFVLACVVLLASNVLTKIFVYKAHVLEGTGNIPLAVNVGSIKELLAEALLSIFGINHGPSYLVGAEWADFSTAIRFVSIVFALILSLLVIAAFAGRKHRAANQMVHWPLAFALLAVLLLIPPILTIRVEQRWELSPFFMLLMVAASGIGWVNMTRARRLLVPAAVGGLLICAAIVEIRVSRSADSIFFVYGDRYAAAAKRAIVDSGSSKPGTPVVLISPPSNCGSTLLDGGFFVIYEGAVRPLYCADSKDAAARQKYPVGSRLFESLPTIDLIDVTDSWKP